MTVLFEHSFKDGMGPFVTRRGGGQDLPSSDDCARVNASGRLVLRLRKDPLRTGHVWVPPDVFRFTEGLVEVEARFPAPPGVHAACWLQGVPPYDTEDHHEVDHGEHFGNPGAVHQSVWRRTGPWGVPGNMTQEPPRGLTGVRVGDAGARHVYGVECSAAGYRFLLDGAETRRVDLPSTAPKALVLSLLSDEWERLRDPLRPPLRDYRAVFSWARVTR